jgi:hypothetical protein
VHGLQDAQREGGAADAAAGQREPDVGFGIVRGRVGLFVPPPAALADLGALGGEDLFEGVGGVGLPAAGDELDEELAGPLDGRALREHSTRTVS